MDTKPTDQTKEHVIAKYVKPARLNGQNAIQVRVGTVAKSLPRLIFGRAPSVFPTLLSKEFQREAGVELVDSEIRVDAGSRQHDVCFRRG